MVGQQTEAGRIQWFGSFVLLHDETTPAPSKRLLYGRLLSGLKKKREVGGQRDGVDLTDNMLERVRTS